MADLSNTEQLNILKLLAGMFNAAPGAIYFNEISQAYVAVGRDWSALAAGLAETSAFKQLYPATMSVSVFSDQFLGSLGLSDVADAQQWISFHAQSGKPYAQLMVQALIALEESEDPVYAAAKQLLANKARPRWPSISPLSKSAALSPWRPCKACWPRWAWIRMCPMAQR